MENNKEILDELNAVAPLLNSLKKESSEVVIPDNYFDNFQTSVCSQVKEESTNVVSIRRSPFRIIKIGIAASVFLAIFFLVVHFKNANNQAEIIVKTPASSTEIQHYITENINDFTVEEVGQFVAMQTNNKIQTEAITTSSNAVMTDEEINQFVENNPVYISDLYDDETATIF